MFINSPIPIPVVMATIPPRVVYFCRPPAAPTATKQDRQAVAKSDEWRKHDPLVPLENVLVDFGLTLADWETMGKTPLIEENGNGKQHG